MSASFMTRVFYAGALLAFVTGAVWWLLPDPTPVGPFFGIPVSLFFLAIGIWMLLLARFPALRGPLR